MDCYTGFAAVYDLFMDNVPYDLWTAHLLSLMEKHGEGRIEPGSLVAELGCGTGEITRRLSAAGFDMIGIDLSEEMLSVARDKMPDTNILWLLQDMRSFELYGTVAAVVSVCDSINYLRTKEDLLQTFRLVNNYLDPGGLFIFDVNTVHHYRDVLSDHTFAETRDEGSFIWENTYDEAAHENVYDLTLYLRAEEGGSEPYFTRTEETHIERAYTVEELTWAIQEAGLTLLEVLDADTMHEPADASERLYFVAREHGK